MFLIIDIYRLGVVYPYLSTSISLDECDYYRYISHIIINVINNDEEIDIAIYLPKKFPDVNYVIDKSVPYNIIGDRTRFRQIIVNYCQTLVNSRKQMVTL